MPTAKRLPSGERRPHPYKSALSELRKSLAAAIEYRNIGSQNFRTGLVDKQTVLTGSKRVCHVPVSYSTELATVIGSPETVR